MTLFFSVQEESDRAAALKALIFAVNQRDSRPRITEIDPKEFARVPGSPFSYWMPPRVRALFTSGVSFEREEESRIVRTTNPFGNNARYVRLWWEVPAEDIGRRWLRWSKGVTTRFWATIDHVVAWDRSRKSYRGFLGTSHRQMQRPASVDLFERPGISWPLRARDFTPSALPTGCVFSVRAFMLSVPREDLLWTLGLAASRIIDYLMKVLLGRVEYPEFIVTALQRVPYPIEVSEDAKRELAALARAGWRIERSRSEVNETSPAFVLPRPLFGGALDDAASKAELERVRQRIDAIAYGLYGLDSDDRAAVEAWAKTPDPPEGLIERQDDGEEDSIESAVTVSSREAIISWCVGVAFGRFDVRLAVGERVLPPEPDPFDPLPVANNDVEKAGSLAIRSGGILVGDPGHKDDIGEAVRAVLARIGQSEFECDDRWLATDYFPIHLRMYSRTRRRAPIYWQLGTPSGSYSIWLYLRSLSADTLYTVQNEYVTPKLAHEERKLSSMLQAQTSPNAGTREEIAGQEEFVVELRALRQEVARVAPLWSPSPDDGVLINFAPLWRLVPHHKAWQTECKATWDGLRAEAYEWAHLAMHLWPERVVPKCADDRSLAIAHELESAFWVEDEDGKWTSRDVSKAEIARIVSERTSQAVKAALKSLLEAAPPAPSGRTGAGRSGGRVVTRSRDGKAQPSRTGSNPLDVELVQKFRSALQGATDGATKGELLGATGLPAARWAAVSRALVEQNVMRTTGRGPGTRYHSAEPTGDA